MKSKLKATALALLMVMLLSAVASAAGPKRIDLGDGFYMVTTSKLDDIQLLDGSKTGSTTGKVYNSGTYIGSITVKATFVYDGISAEVSSKSASVTTASGWSYKNKSVSSTSGSATATCTFYSGSKSTSASVTVYCDKNGNIS